mmetsp:Transcript_16394/g.41667  ORF Transcript_16394/g.41667 Transcript_16394/m.41667 type:complete len:935 (-) Transcript_16394:275-3079(-)
MAGGKKSVDEIWAALNSRPTSTNVNINSFGGLPGIQTRARVVTEGPVVSESFQSVTRTAQATGAAYDPTRAGVTLEERDAYLVNIQRDINCLSDPERGTRRRALEKLSDVLFKGTRSLPAASPAMLQAVACGPLLSALVSLMADPMEKVRELDFILLRRLLEAMPDPEALLPAIMPAMHKRFGALPVEETSEELRREIADLLSNVLSKLAAPALIQNYKEEVVAIFLRGLEDNFHEIKKTASVGLTNLTERIPAGSLESCGEELATLLIANCSHQHSKVRQTSVEGLCSVVVSGVPAGVLSDHVAPGVKRLLSDRSSATRKAVLTAVAAWLGAGEAGAPLRAGDHPVDWRPRIEKLLPLLLVGLTDEAPQTGSLALALLDEVGEGYAALDPDVEMATEPEAAPHICELVGAPLTGPPKTNTCTLVQRNLKHLLLLALKDVRDWSAGTRDAGARLLHMALVFAGSKATDHADLLVPALCSAIGDDEAPIAQRILSCVHILGSQVDIQVLLPLALDHLGKSQQTVSQVASCLVVLAGLLHAAATWRTAVPGANDIPGAVLERTASALACEDIRSLNHLAVEKQLLAATTNLIKVAGPKSVEICLPLLSVLLQLKTDKENKELRKSTDEVLGGLAAVCGFQDGAALVGNFAEPLLIEIGKGHATWSSSSADRDVMGALMWSVEPSTLESMVPLVLPMLKECVGGAEKDPAMRIDLLRLLDGLLEDAERGRAFQGMPGIHLVLTVIFPACVWVAGKTAAAVRFQAVTAAATFFRRRLVSPEQAAALLSRDDFLPVLHQCLEEDYYADTRFAACHVMAGLLRCVGVEMRDASRRAVYPELCKRLDDSNDGNRIAACAALEAFAEVSPSYDTANVGYLLERLLVHMDDFNQAVQEAVCKVVCQFARSHPSKVREEVTKVSSRHRSQKYIQQVLGACAGGV